jgi:GNAT superfamily N-acetyltransferase
MTGDQPSAADPHVSVRPANEVSWEDIQTVFGTRGEAAACQCQYFKILNKDWSSVPVAERAFRLRQQTDCGYPDAEATTGLVAFLDGVPVGWCAVEPRSAYPRLRNAKVPWTGREEDKDDDTVWAVTCFMVRTGYRRRGISSILAKAAVEYARDRGARALEGYPMVDRPNEEIAWPSEMYVGTRSIFSDAGFTEITKPTKRRFVMRIDF